MDTLRLPTSRLTRRLALLPALLLLLGLVAGGVHHHAREDGSHACAICTLSHAPATAAVAAIEPETTTLSARVTLPAAVAPRAAGPVSPSSRAPPSI
jgi:hypothetical protein